MKASSNLSAHLALFVVAVIYGSNYVVAKEVLTGGFLEPIPFITLRVLFGATLFWILISSRKREVVAKKDLRWMLVCSIFGIAVNQICFFMGLDYTTPIKASLIMTTSPIIILVASAIILKEHLTKRKVIGLLIGAVGAIVLIANGQSITSSQGEWVGDLLVLANAASYSIYLVLVRDLMRKYNPFTVMAWVFTFGILWVLPLGLPGLLETDWQTFPISIWLAIGFVLLFTTFFTYLLNGYALTKVNPSIVGIYIYLQPVVASIIALTFGKDYLNLVKIIAGLCIFVGVYLVSLPTHRVKEATKKF